MSPYVYPAGPAATENFEAAPGATVQAFAITDPTFEEPLTLTLISDGSTTDTLTVSPRSWRPAFSHPTQAQVILRDSGGAFAQVLTSFSGLLAAAQAAQSAAEASAASALAANTLPGGGSTGQFVAKASAADFDFTYVDPAVTGGGGHIIRDEGTPTVQRAALDFVGAVVAVTDDSGAGATVVTVDAAPAAILTSADPDLDTFAKLAAALDGDPAFAATVSTALTGKADTLDTIPVYVATSTTLPSRAAFIAAHRPGYTGPVRLKTTGIADFPEVTALAFCTQDDDEWMRLRP